ncbi:hypothetical protein K2X05_12905 [bacterium]|nr:hypothetical protein [bacterium]
MLKPVLDFLFGKDAKIFNKKGTVEHSFGKQKWSHWTDRFAKNPDYDFTKHTGRSQKTDSSKHS